MPRGTAMRTRQQVLDLMEGLGPDVAHEHLRWALCLAKQFMQDAPGCNARAALVHKVPEMMAYMEVGSYPQNVKGSAYAASLVKEALFYLREDFAEHTHSKARHYA